MKRSLQISLSVVVSVLFIWLTLKDAPLPEVWNALEAADWTWVGLYFLLFSAIHFVRVVRWKFLLEPIVRPPFAVVNAVGAVSFMALMLMPLRLGEFVRPILVAEYMGPSKSAAFASVVLERLIDGVSLGLLLVVLLWTVPHADARGFEIYRAGAAVVTLAFIGGVLFLALAVRHRSYAQRLLGRVCAPVSKRLAQRLSAMLDAFVDALAVLPSWRRGVELLLLTALFWFLSGFGLLLMARAFGFTLRLPEGFTVLCLGVLGSMIPTGPGMAGPIQLLTVESVELFKGTGFHASVVAFAHAVWGVQIVQQTLFGLFFIATGRISVRSLALSKKAYAPSPASADAHGLHDAPDEAAHENVAHGQRNA